MNTEPAQARADDVRAALEEAVEIAGSQAALAAKIGGKVKQQHVSYWIANCIVPERHVLAIEAATERRVTRHRLAPHIYPIEEPRAAAHA